MPKKPIRQTAKCAECVILEKQLKRLKRQVARLTKSQDGKPTKQLYFGEKDVAVRLGMSVKTLQNWRVKGEGPKFQKIGRSVRYRLRDILAYEKRVREESMFSGINVGASLHGLA